MTTAHKPTYHPAVGTSTQGGYRYHAPRSQYSAKDVAAHTVLKVRQPGQGTSEEVGTRDLKSELIEREREHTAKIDLDKKRKGLLPYAEKTVDPAKEIDFKKFDDSDDSDQEDAKSGSDSEDDEDDEAELQRELTRLKKEKEEERLKKEAKQREEEEAVLNEDVLKGNPLLSTGDGFGVKRRWDDDVVFKNQARDQRKVQKRFINDTIRSDFHRNFLKKYVQ